MKEPNIVIDSKREDPFNRIAKDVAENAALSFQARGVMSYLLGKPVNWCINVWDLVKRSPHGKSFIRKVLEELRILGYMKLEQQRSALGEFEGYLWRLSDQPKWYDEPENKMLRDKYMRRCSALKRPKKFLRAEFKTPPSETPDTEIRSTANPTPVTRHYTKNEGNGEGRLRRKTARSALQTRMSNIRAALRAKPGDDSDSMSAPIGAVQLALPTDMNKEDLALALESPECVTFLRYWLASYKPVFGREYSKFTAADVLAAMDLTSNGSPVEDVFTAVVTAWSKVVPGNAKEHNPYWACNHYSRRLADLTKVNSGQTMSNYERILLELDWRSKQAQVEAAWAWLEKAKRGRAGLPDEEVEAE